MAKKTLKRKIKREKAITKKLLIKKEKKLRQ